MGAPLADLAADSMRRVGSHLEMDLLGTTEPDDVATAIVSTCETLGKRAGARSSTRPESDSSSDCVWSDGREVVVKLHRFNATAERLTACLEVQAHLNDAGLPAPRPLLPVVPIGSGFATVEELRVGTTADGRDPAVRRSMAIELHRFIEAARPLARDVALDPLWLPASPDDPLWATPHDLRFDFAATATGRRVDRRARPRRLRASPGRRRRGRHRTRRLARAEPGVRRRPGRRHLRLGLARPRRRSRRSSARPPAASRSTGAPATPTRRPRSTRCAPSSPTTSAPGHGVHAERARRPRRRQPGA